MSGESRPGLRGQDRAPEKPSGRAAGGSVPPVGRSCNPAIDFAALMPDVARALLGEPNRRLSTARELRYGARGSLAVHVGGERAGTWYDFEAGESGGVLALVAREAGARDSREAMAWLRDAGLLDGEPARQALGTARTPNPPERDSEPIPGPDDADARCKLARRVWKRTKPLRGTIAETYLTARGVGHVGVAPALRFSPALSHPCAPGRFPCLVAGVQDAAGGFLGVQRTYLAADGAGKANVEPPRASLGSLSGGAVRLGEPESGRLVVGEGIESTAAAMVLFDAPGWAALGTSGLRTIELPEHVRDVVIAADRDAGGLRAAAALYRRLETEGRGVEIRPPHKGDFNDALMARSATP